MTKNMDKNRAESLSAYIDGLNDGTTSSVAESVAELYGGESIRDLVGVVTPFQKDSLFEPAPAASRAAAFQKMRATLAQENATAVVSQPNSVPVTQRTDILILMLQSMDEMWGALWGNLKLIKLPFLLAQEGQCASYVPNFYFPNVEEAAYNFGAFDKDVLSDIDQLVAMGIVEKKSPAPKRQSQSGDLGIPDSKQVDWIYGLTPRGKKIAQMLTRGADPVVLGRIQAVIKEHGNKTADELCSYTYKKYPKSAANSKIRDKYLPKEDTASSDCEGRNDA